MGGRAQKRTLQKIRLLFEVRYDDKQAGEGPVEATSTMIISTSGRRRSAIILARPSDLTRRTRRAPRRNVNRGDLLVLGAEAGDELGLLRLPPVISMGTDRMTSSPAPFLADGPDAGMRTSS